MSPATQTPSLRPGCGLVLASASEARAGLLRAAGLSFDIAPADIDEAAIKRRFDRDGRPPADSAQALAEAKALAGAAAFGENCASETIFLGADQILVLDGRAFDKPRDRAEAKARVSELSGRTHILETAAALARQGEIVWRARAAPRLTMRALTDRQIDDYLARAGDEVLASVGAYQLEGLGVQLFERIEGDFFSILGLPLPPLLAALRKFGVAGVL